MVLYSDKSVYFLTGSTFLHYPYFRSSQQKQIVLDQIKKLKCEKNIPICAYSIQINHYHLLFYVRKRDDIATVKKFMHGGTSYMYRKGNKVPYNDFWGTNKNVHVFSSDMYWKIIGYICGNLIKHREAGTFNELKQNYFSSYSYFSEKYGENFIQEIIYRVIHTPEDSKGVLDMKALGVIDIGTKVPITSTKVESKKYEV